jgi:hypothetical protein
VNVNLYADAREAFKRGDRKLASELLGQAMGGHGSDILEENLEKFFDSKDEIGQLTCHMVALETVKQRWGKGLYPKKRKRKEVI